MSESKKSKFKRKNMDRYPRVSYSWRKPTGHGRPKKLGDMPKVGYRTPRNVRGLHPSGYEDKLVHNKNDLKGVDEEMTAIRIASDVGRKKRIQILKEALSRDIKVLNIEDPEEYVKESKEKESEEGTEEDADEGEEDTEEEKEGNEDKEEGSDEEQEDTEKEDQEDEEGEESEDQGEIESKGDDK